MRVPWHWNSTPSPKPKGLSRLRGVVSRVEGCSWGFVRPGWGEGRSTYKDTIFLYFLISHFLSSQLIFVPIFHVPSSTVFFLVWTTAMSIVLTLKDCSKRPTLEDVSKERNGGIPTPAILASALGHFLVQKVWSWNVWTHEGTVYTSVTVSRASQLTTGIDFQGEDNPLSIHWFNNN